MGDSSSLPSKPDVVRSLLLRGTVFVHLDPRAENVVVPPWFKDQPQLVLQIGIDMRPLPIPDLRVDEHGVVATLSFSRQPFLCSVPWESVFALVGDDGRGMVWPESMPIEIASEVEREVRRKAEQRGAKGEAPAKERAHPRGGSNGSGDPLAAGTGRGSPRRATRKGTKKHQPNAERVPRARRKPPSLAVIQGEGEGGASAPNNGERPRHLKLVK